MTVVFDSEVTIRDCANCWELRTKEGGCFYAADTLWQVADRLVENLNNLNAGYIKVVGERDKFEKLINELRVQLDQKDDMLRTLAEQAASSTLQAEYVDIATELAEERDKVKELLIERRDQHTEIVKLETHAAAQAKDLSNALNTIKELRDKNASLNAQLDVYDTGNFADLQEENKTLDRRVGELEVALSEANEARNELLKELGQHKAKLSEANDSIKRMQVEHALFPDATVVPRHIAFSAPMKLDAMKNTPIPESSTYTAAQVAALIKALGV